MQVDSPESNDSEMDEVDDGTEEDDSTTSNNYKWTDLKHSGPAFPPPFKRLPNHVYLKYDGQKVPLSELAEEMAAAYAKLLHRKFASETVFKKNFFNDWKNAMTLEEKARIDDIKKCDFTIIKKFVSMKRMPRNKNDPEVFPQDPLKETYGFCTIDGLGTEIGNYNMEPPGLYRSNTSNRGKWKRRILPEDVIINCSEGYEPPGEHQWAAIVHDRSVSWLAKWQNPISGSPKYMRLSPSAKLNGEEDCRKYDTAVELGTHIERIRRKYREEWESEDTIQLAVAVYLIDTFAFRAGGDHDDTDDADTVGCCTLRVEHLTLHDVIDDELEVVEFDFDAKASIRYKNKQKIEHGAFAGLKSLATGKDPNDLIFDQLTTDKVNKYLKNCMDNLTTKVFRTFRASSMLEAELRLKTESNMTEAEKLRVFRSANLKVAKLCNHRRTLSTIRLETDIFENHQEIVKITREIQSTKDVLTKQMKQSRIQYLTKEIEKLEQELSEKKGNLLPAMNSSKEHYIDPRVVVAWCLKFDIPFGKIYSNKLLSKFRWAVDQDSTSFIFYRNENSTDGSSEAGCSYR